MNINACIYDSDGNLAGCITDSVLAQFRNELEGIKEEFEDDSFVQNLLSKLDTVCQSSEANCSPDFLNALKILVKDHKYDISMDLAQSLSRAYHNLIRYCCSNIVYDEVLNATIGQFRDDGIEYLGTVDKINGREAYAFLYNNVHVSICMVEKQDLYNFWCRKVDDMVHALISFNGKGIMVSGVDGPRLCNAIKACIDDMRDDEEPADDKETLDELAKVLLEVAKILLKKDDE